MNYLAHAYLSFNIPEILAGNMISDFVKGNKQYNYPTGIQAGIRLHRAIDTFTDSHPFTKQAKTFFRPAVGPYAGAFVDVVYDHFLAKDHTEFIDDAGLQAFATNTYLLLNNLAPILPQPFVNMLPFMRQHNWLYNYQFMQGIESSFKNVARRAKYLDNSDACFQLFQAHYVSFEMCYANFFKDVKKIAISFLSTEGFL
ncbi:MAG: ACP phosphodiesterase [Flavobacterium sp.]|nr:ACP phosphodiesterase [Flavobacterium sp.]